MRVTRCGAHLARGAAPSISRIIAPSVESDAPPNSSRCVGPHSVTSWPKMRCQMSSSGKPASATPEQTRIRTPPSGACRPPGRPDRGRAGLLGRQEDRDQPGEEDPEQPDEDEVVRGVGERARIAARVEVGRDVPVHAEHGDQQRAGEHAERERAPRRAAPRRAPRSSPSLLQQLDAPAAVPEHEVEHRRGHDHRADRAADHLPDLAAARRRRAGSSLRQNVI